MVSKWVVSPTYNPSRLTWNIIMEIWKMIFLSKVVICRFQSLIFQGAPEKLASQKGKDRLRTVNFQEVCLFHWGYTTYKHFIYPTNPWIVKIKRSFWRSWYLIMTLIFGLEYLHTRCVGHLYNLWVWVTFSLTIPKKIWVNKPQYFTHV